MITCDYCLNLETPNTLVKELYLLAHLMTQRLKKLPIKRETGLRGEYSSEFESRNMEIIESLNLRLRAKISGF